MKNSKIKKDWKARLLARWHAKLKNWYFFWHVGTESWKIDTLARGHAYWHASTLARGHLDCAGTYGMNDTDLASSIFLYVFLPNNSSINFLFQQIFIYFYLLIDFILFYLFFIYFFADKGFDKNCTKESSLSSSEQN